MQRAERRQSAATKTGILNAAEALFAERGYSATSMAEIAAAASVSVATPSYFFGSKAGLYRAVLQRAFEDARDALATGLADVLAREGASLEEKVSAGVKAYMDFLLERPNFVRLIEWENVEGGRFTEADVGHNVALSSALEHIAAILPDIPGVDARHLLLSVIALCFFPLAHAATLLRPLGFDPEDPAFVEERQQHVVALLLGGIERGAKTQPSHTPRAGP